MPGHGVPNKKVQDVIGGMGYRKPRAESPNKMSPQVARLLQEELGVKVPASSVRQITEADPLSAPGSAPMADPSTPATPAPTVPPESTPTKPQGSSKLAPGQGTADPTSQPKVELKSDVNRITTLQDLKGKMDEVAQRITLIDTLTQALMGDQTQDNSIEKHRKTLSSAVDSLADSVNELKAAVAATGD